MVLEGRQRVQTALLGPFHGSFNRARAGNSPFCEQGSVAKRKLTAHNKQLARLGNRDIRTGRGGWGGELQAKFFDSGSDSRHDMILFVI